MTLATYLTFLRILLTPVGLIFLLWSDVPFHFHWAIAVFAVAMLTDFLDGYLSRRLNAVTTFGARLDIIADKIIILTYLSFLHMRGIYPLWLLVILILRELLVLLALASMPLDQAPSVPFPAKLKIGLQTLSILLGVLVLSMMETGTGNPEAIAAWSLWTMIVGFLCGLYFPVKRLPTGIRIVGLTFPMLLTFARLACAITGSLLIVMGSFRAFLLATFLFILALITDFLDGKIARRLDQTTALGTYLDSLMDRFLVIFYLLALTWRGGYSWWLTIPVLLTEVTLQYVKHAAMRKREPIKPTIPGRIKGIVNFISIFLVLFSFQVVMIPSIQSVLSENFLRRMAALFLGMGLVVNVPRFFISHSPLKFPRRQKR